MGKVRHALKTGGTQGPFSRSHERAYVDDKARHPRSPGSPPPSTKGIVQSRAESTEARQEG